MITVKRILEQYDIVTDKASSHDLYLADLASSGIIEEEKIPMLRRSLNKNINEMTVAEKKSLVSLIESLMANVIVEKSGGTMSYPSDKDMPTVIILKRKAIRVFPDNQKIGLYYSQALDRYISIPFGPNVKDLSPQLNEETVAQRLAKQKEEKEKKQKTSARMIPPKISIQPKTSEQPASKLTTSVPSVQNKTTSKKRALPWGNREVTAITPEMREKAAQEVIDNSPNVSGKIGAMIGRSFARAAEKTPLRSKTTTIVGKPLEESFRNNLKMIREKREYGTADAALDAASFLPGPAGSAASLASAGMSLSRGDYTGAALDVAGALPGVGYLAKAAKVAKAGSEVSKVAKAGSEVSKVAKPSRVADIVKSVGRGVGRTFRGAGRLAKGAAELGAAALSGAGDDKIKNTQSREFGFSGPGQASIKIGDPQSQQQVLGAGGVRSAQQQADLYSRIPGMPRSAANESTISTLKQIVENNVPSQQLQIGEETISINKSIAKKIIRLHEALNRTNKKKLERMLNEDIVSFRKVVNFALK